MFGVGLNYCDHAAESGLEVPAGEPLVFTKFASCVTGPRGDIELPPGAYVDWEVELVAVIGRGARHVPADGAGATSPASPSARTFPNGSCSSPPAAAVQPGQVLPGFAPVGPVLVTLDELAAPGDLALGCRSTASGCRTAGPAS